MVSYKLKLTDSTIFMANSISNFVNNLAKKIRNKKFEKYEIQYQDLEVTNNKDELLIYKCLYSNRN